MCLSCNDYFTYSKYKVIKVFDDQYHISICYLQYQSQGFLFKYLIRYLKVTIVFIVGIERATYNIYQLYILKIQMTYFLINIIIKYKNVICKFLMEWVGHNERTAL